jgi:hypothetical protein
LRVEEKERRRGNGDGCGGREENLGVLRKMRKCREEECW